MGDCELRPYQQIAINALWYWFRKNNGAVGAPVIVAPTGAGKSWIAAAIARDICKLGTDRSVTILAHRRELLSQNAEKLLTAWPEAPLGIYSASLNRRERGQQITVAGIDTVYDKAELLGPQSLLIIDECHLVQPNDEGKYNRFIRELRQLSPATRIVGLTATPYRLDCGVIARPAGTLFTDIAHQIELLPLIDQGFLCPIISRSGQNKPDLSDVKVADREFVRTDLEKVFLEWSNTPLAIREVELLAIGRRSWLFFCCGLEHAAETVRCLKARGHSAELVAGSTPPAQRDRILADFREGRLKCVVNCETLTTGTDIPGIDVVVLLRGTKSPGLFYQMVGRGLRMAPSKQNCMLLDYGGNLERHGPIDGIRVLSRRGTKPGEEKFELITGAAQMASCPICSAVALASHKKCQDCGAQLVIAKPVPRAPNHATKSSSLPATSAPTEVAVDRVTYSRHTKNKSPDSLKVVYHLAGTGEEIPEWVLFEHFGRGRDDARKWWLKRTRRRESPPPGSVAEALRRANELHDVSKIRIVREGRFWRVTGGSLRKEAVAS